MQISSSRNPSRKRHPAAYRKAFFSLPDLTVGFGISPNQLIARGLSPPVENTLVSEENFTFSIYHGAAMLSTGITFFFSLIMKLLDLRTFCL